MPYLNSARISGCICSKLWTSWQQSFTGRPLWPNLQVGRRGDMHPPKSLTMVCDFYKSDTFDGKVGNVNPPGGFLLNYIFFLRMYKTSHFV